MRQSQSYTPLTLSQLQSAMQAGPPENESRDEGYALVNVLDAEAFEREHIPGSINIPRDDLDAFGERFDEEKKIVVYCASHECPASREAAEALAKQGFQHVFDYEGGTREWKESGKALEGSAVR